MTPSPLDLPEADFRRLTQRITELASGWLQGLDARPITPAARGQDTEALFDGALPEEGLGDTALDALVPLLDACRAYNARFLGYVFGGGSPVGALGDFLASVLNQNTTAWRSSPAAVSLERALVREVARTVGCEGFGGSLCGGGSAANLMGLALAREARAPANEDGVRPGGVVYASSEVHMSIPKAVALLGLGRKALRLVPVDAELRLVPAALARAVEEDLAAGRRPIAVVASAGTVNTGAVDPLEAVADVAEAHGLWLHVDGAYGGLAALARPELFRGIQRADSLSLDAHKWLHQPVDCGLFLFKDAGRARAAFSHAGDYARVLGGAEDVEGFAFFDESLELSRRFRALKLWLSLRYHGLGAFRDAIGRDLAHAKALGEAIRREPRLQHVGQGPLSAVCFQYVGSVAAAERDAFNAALLPRLNARGRVYLSNATLDGRFCLRACFVNHRTRLADVQTVVDEVLATGAALEAERAA